MHTELKRKGYTTSPITAINHKLPAKITFIEQKYNQIFVIIYNKKANKLKKWLHFFSKQPM